MEPNFSGLLAAVQFVQIRATRHTTVLSRPTGTPLQDVIATKKSTRHVAARDTAREKK